jgi:hypothetical protein
MQHRDLLLQHQNETLSTFLRNLWNIQKVLLQHTPIPVCSPAASPGSSAGSLRPRSRSPRPDRTTDKLRPHHALGGEGRQVRWSAQLAQPGRGGVAPGAHPCRTANRALAAGSSGSHRRWAPRLAAPLDMEGSGVPPAVEIPLLSATADGRWWLAPTAADVRDSHAGWRLVVPNAMTLQQSKALVERDGTIENR